MEIYGKFSIMFYMPGIVEVWLSLGPRGMPWSPQIIYSNIRSSDIKPYITIGCIPSSSGFMLLLKR
eukprot:12423574-Karenia_brevis.AAC.1